MVYPNGTAVIFKTAPCAHFFDTTLTEELGLIAEKGHVLIDDFEKAKGESKLLSECVVSSKKYSLLELELVSGNYLDNFPFFARIRE